MESRKLYNRKNVFYLVVGAVTTEIEEPIKWDSITADLEMNREYYGFKYEFSDKDVMLEFDEAAGYTIIKNEYELKGVDAAVTLQFGYIDLSTDVFIKLFEGDLNFEIYEINKFVIKCNVERKSINQLIRTRFDAAVDLKSLQSLDGVALTTLPSQRFFNFPIQEKRTCTLRYNTDIPAVQAPTTVFSFRREYCPPVKIISNNVDGADTPFPDRYPILFRSGVYNSGLLTRQIRVTADIRIRVTCNSPEVLNRQVLLSLNQYNVASPGFSIDSATDIVEIPNAQVYTCRLSIDKVFRMQESQFIAILVIVTGIDSPGEVVSNIEYIETDAIIVSLEEISIFKSSESKALYIHDALKRVKDLILPANISLKSSIYGRIADGYLVNGEESSNLFMDGKSLRRIEKPFNVSLKNLVDSLNTLHNVGMGVERDTNDNEVLVIEKAEYFYRDILLHHFTEVSNYSSKPATENIYNSLEFGFTKFPNDNQNGSLGDYLTKMEYQTSVKAIKNKFTKLSSILLSSYYISYTQRESFSTNPDNAYETDEDLFLVKINNDQKVFNGVAAIEFRLGAFNDIIVRTAPSSLPMPFIEGSTFTISGHPVAANNKPYSIESASVETLASGFTYTIKVTETFLVGANSAANILFTYTGDILTPVISTGSTTPVGSFNPDFTITKQLKEFSKIWSGGLKPLNNTLLKFVKGSNNTSIDGIDFIVNESVFSTPLFGYNIFEFEASMDWETLNLIRMAFEGRHPDNKDYGYFTLDSPDGVLQKGFLQSIKFNIVKETAKIKLIEKL